MVFIQFAGFTFGKSASAYATPWHGYPGNNTSYLIGGHDTVTGVNNIQYTANFGNGVSGTIGLDDPVVFNRTAVANLNLGLTATGGIANAYGGVHAPDVVGNIRVDQAWGLFQISAAAHDVNASYNILNASFINPAGIAGLGTGQFPTAGPAGAVATAAGAPSSLSELSGHPSDKWGGSVMAALQIKNIPWGAGDDIKVDATYAKGDTKNVISTAAASPSFTIFGNTNRPGAYQSVGFGATTDAVYLPVINGGDGSLHLTTAYGLRGAYNHNWDPYWSSSIFGSYSSVRYDGVAKLQASAPSVVRQGCFRRLQLQPGLQRIAARRDHPLDPCQEPDVLGGSHVVPPRPEIHRFCHSDADGSEADRYLRLPRSGRTFRSTFAYSATSDPRRKV